MIAGLQALLSNLMQQMDGYLSQLWATPDDYMLRDRIRKLIGDIRLMRERLLIANLREEAYRAQEMADLASKRLHDLAMADLEKDRLQNIAKKPEPKKPKGPGF